MSLPKMGKSFPKTGNIFPETSYALAVAVALHQNLGSTRRAIKTLSGWTNANERTVKNWLAGTRGPSGEHLLALARHSDHVFEAILILTRRRHVVSSVKITELRDKLVDVLTMLQVDGE